MVLFLFLYANRRKTVVRVSDRRRTTGKCRVPIQSYKIINNREIHLEFSEEILQPKNVTIFQDSTDVELHVIASSFGGNSMKMLVEKQDTVSYVLNFPKMEDLKGNFYENYKLKFSGRTIVDSIAPVLLNSIPQTGSIIEDQLPIITIEYSEIILAENFLSKLWEVESGKEIEISILKANSDVIQLQPKEKLRNLSSYKLELKSFDLNKR